MMRPSESVSGAVVINGATWVLVSAVVLLLVFPFRLGAQALFMFMVADAFAALVGQRLGKHPWPRSLRTIEGTAAFIVVGIAAGALFPGVGLRPVIAAALVGAAAEVPRRPLNDNVRVPLVIAVVLLAAQNYFP
jgi:dolichol kinase